MLSNSCYRWESFGSLNQRIIDIKIWIKNNRNIKKNYKLNYLLKLLLNLISVQWV
jgi:hypothetical protein